MRNLDEVATKTKLSSALFLPGWTQEFRAQSDTAPNCGSNCDGLWG